MNSLKCRRIVIFVFAMLPGWSSAGAYASDPAAVLSRYARAHEWVEKSQAKPGHVSCDTLLKDIQKAHSLIAIAPRIKADDAYNSALGELTRCSEYKVPERREAPVPNDFFWGANRSRRSIVSHVSSQAF